MAMVHGNGMEQFDSVHMLYDFKHNAYALISFFPALPAWHFVEVRPVSSHAGTT